MTARLLMIALDAADTGLLRRWSDEGRLPALAALRGRGRLRPLAAAAASTDDALWASFQYQAPEAEHGRYHYLVPQADGRFAMAWRGEAGRESFWQALGRAGQRVAVLDVPKCGPPQPLNGLHLVDWLVHGRNFQTPRSFPPELAVEVLGRFGPPPPSRCAYHQPAWTDAEVLAIAADLGRGVEQSLAAGLHYLAAEPWDLFLIGFKAAHCGGHALWELVDPAHRRCQPGRDARLGHPLRGVFAALDAAIGRLVEAAGPAAEVVVFSTGDMRPNGTLDHLLPGIVQRLNACLAPAPAAGLRQRVRRLLDRAPPAAVSPLPYNEHCGALRLGDRSESGKRHLALRVAQLLAELRDGEDGGAALERISFPSQAAGARAATLPDLLLHYRPNRFPAAVVSPTLGRIAAQPLAWRSGNHAGGGLALAAGRRAGEALEAVRGLQDLGRLAARVLLPPA